MRREVAAGKGRQSTRLKLERNLKGEFNDADEIYCYLNCLFRFYSVF